MRRSLGWCETSSGVQGGVMGCKAVLGLGRVVSCAEGLQGGGWAVQGAVRGCSGMRGKAVIGGVRQHGGEQHAKDAQSISRALG